MSDDKQVQEAFYHWMPRFIANNVDYSDLQRIKARLESWDDWRRVWSEAGAEHEALAEAAVEAGHPITGAEAYKRAAIYYHFANAIFYRDKAQKQAAHRQKLACFAKAVPYFNPPSQRLEIPFEDTSLPAYFRAPDGPGPHPCVIMVCGLDSVKEQETEWEEELLRRGMATLSFDGPGQGEMWERMKLRLDFEEAVVAVVDYLSSREEIDASRLGLIGHSMGGYFGARAAAREQRLAAAVLLAGFFELPPWEKMSVFMRAGLQHIFDAASEAEAAALAQQLSLADVADKIRCPILIIHGAKDTLIPATDAQRLAEATTCPTELVIYEEGNHSMNNFVYKMRPQVVDWLADRFVSKVAG
jgi:2,6-dihydroxypseudooxynicotine hydrolase